MVLKHVVHARRAAHPLFIYISTSSHGRRTELASEVVSIDGSGPRSLGGYQPIDMHVVPRDTKSYYCRSSGNCLVAVDRRGSPKRVTGQV